VNNDFAIIAFVRKEIVPNPKQVINILFSERNAGSDARMDKEKIATDEERI